MPSRRDNVAAVLRENVIRDTPLRITLDNGLTKAVNLLSLRTPEDMTGIILYPGEEADIHDAASLAGCPFAQGPTPRESKSNAIAWATAQATAAGFAPKQFPLSGGIPAWHHLTASESHNIVNSWRVPQWYLSLMNVPGLAPVLTVLLVEGIGARKTTLSEVRMVFN
ncbi:Uncharacterized protein PBTT_08815 [Plasmodiophora brassicae]|uniref:Uncharacterized protein n=1 Tax=Plasmodiophora brassicae TaxID=37360 RepID=A0A0G4INI4_PLABS|nr:hypothetical protein PBRA_005356 [Plasmodiophora brassicae]